MKRHWIIYSIFAITVLIFGSRFANGAEESQSIKLERRTKIVYLDPWYGGKEKGPLFGSKTYGKAITLDIARKIQSQLEAVGFKVYLSRDDDRFVNLEQRLLQGKSRGAGVHLAIKISQTNKDCVRIYFASPPIRKHETTSTTKTYSKEELGPELDRIIKDLITDDIIEESIFISQIISDKLKSGSAANCFELRRGKDYILKNAQLPTVMVDFRISPSPKKPFTLDATSLDEIASFLADSIKDYSEQRKPKEENK